jgi:hypothetical protein
LIVGLISWRYNIWKEELKSEQAIRNYWDSIIQVRREQTFEEVARLREERFQAEVNRFEYLLKQKQKWKENHTYTPKKVSQ